VTQVLEEAVTRLGWQVLASNCTVRLLAAGSAVTRAHHHTRTGPTPPPPHPTTTRLCPASRAWVARCCRAAATTMTLSRVSSAASTPGWC
jgi:hypothetical protein